MGDLEIWFDQCLWYWRFKYTKDATDFGDYHTGDTWEWSHILQVGPMYIGWYS